MTRRNRPAVDHMIAAAHGVSRDGQPLSYNRAPAPDLAPWIGRLYAVKVRAPADYRLHCGILSDTAMMHVPLEGAWSVDVGGNTHRAGPIALCTGPHTRRRPICVTGSFTSVGYSLRPGVVPLFGPVRMIDFLDRARAPQDIGQPSAWSVAQFHSDAHPECWLQTIERGLRAWLHGDDRPDGRHAGLREGQPEQRREPHPITNRFENAAFTDPTISIAAFAADCGVGERTVERIVLRDFGMPPKQVLRRARALDMASHLRGVADEAEAEELALRYYDQSHLIREFTDLFGMLPSQFVATPQPLLTLSLELRQARRLEAIDRLSPGSIRPWE